tara:strand:+ start:2899 stop:3198 length:300 start_codon:yes stop_codon:yes gene_type:complete
MRYPKILLNSNTLPGEKKLAFMLLPFVFIKLHSGILRFTHILTISLWCLKIKAWITTAPYPRFKVSLRYELPDKIRKWSYRDDGTRVITEESYWGQMII